jgi:paraquat-inducible protein B
LVLFFKKEHLSSSALVVTTTGTQTTVGAFVLGGTALAVAAALLFGKFHLFTTVKVASVVFQDSIKGLSIGSPVTFRGVAVGAVTNIAIEFEPKTHIAYIPVTIQLDSERVKVSRDGKVDNSNLAELVARGLRAELNTQSFVTGSSEIDLDFDPAVPAQFHPDITSLTEIPTKQSTIQRVTETLSQLPLRELVDNATATLNSLRGLSKKLDDGLPPLVQSVKATSDHAGQLIGTAQTTLRDVQAHLDETLDAISRLAQSGDRELAARGDDLRRALAAAVQTANRASATLDGIKSLTSERGADRANLDSALRDIAAAAAALRGFASDVEHNPQLLLTGRKP